MFKRLATATVTVALLVALVSAAAMVASGRGAATASTGTPSNAGGQSSATWGLGAGLWQGARGALRGHRLGRAILTVTAVSGNTINATTARSTAVTITVDATTVYTQAGVSATLSDVHAGSIVGVQGTRTGQNTVQASTIVIVLPRVAGVVTAVNGSTLSVTGRDALPHTINVSSGTQYRSGGQAALSGIAVGTAIVAQGPLNVDGSMNALRVQIVLPHVAGKITAVNGSTVTVTDLWGTAHTVVTSSSTIYMAPFKGTASAASLAVGARIVVMGTLTSDGKTINAQRIMVVPAMNRRARGFFGHGLRGGAKGLWGGIAGRGGLGNGFGAQAPGAGNI